MHSFSTGLLLFNAATSVLAFPSLANLGSQKNSRVHVKRVLGVNPGFDASAQQVDVSGIHAFMPPGHGDQRGPCPGLNALANHNYLPHNGIATIEQFVTATTQVFGMGLDLATFLAVYGAVVSGDGTSWSIGGPPLSTSGLLPPNLLSPPQGISNSHNKYETDASPTRGDLYQYGNDYLLRLDQFKALFAKQSDAATANYDIPVLTAFRAERFQQSISQNPYFFNGPVSGIAVQPAAYTFIYRFFANHTSAHPDGVLNQEVLKSFFAITGGPSPDQFTYRPGHERIPKSWYRRAINDEYTIPYYASDANIMALQHPQFLSVGGNTGTTNTFTGVDTANLTGGVYNAQTLLQGNNAACFAYQAAILSAPDLLKGLVVDVAGAVQKIADSLATPLQELGCPQLAKLDERQLQAYPGYTKVNKKTGQY